MADKEKKIITFDKDAINFIRNANFGIAIVEDNKIDQICLFDSVPTKDDYATVYQEMKVSLENFEIREATNWEIHTLKQHIFKDIKAPSTDV